MSFSNYLETKVLAHVFSNTGYTSPTTVYVGLFTSVPSETGGGVEVAGGAYVRKPGSFTTTGNQATTSVAIEWPTSTAAWGTITSIGIYDAASGGNLLAYANLSASKTIASGDVFRIPAGDIDITLD